MVVTADGQERNRGTEGCRVGTRRGATASQDDQKRDSYRSCLVEARLNYARLNVLYFCPLPFALCRLPSAICPCGSNPYTGTCRSGIGRATNTRRQGFASIRAIRSERAWRALSVAIPVFAYI